MNRLSSEQCLFRGEGDSESCRPLPNRPMNGYVVKKTIECVTKLASVVRVNSVYVR